MILYQLMNESMLLLLVKIISIMMKAIKEY